MGMKKILFNDRCGLTQAVLDGRKIQTRRIIPQPIIDKVNDFHRRYFAQTLDALSPAEAFNQYFFIKKIGKLPYRLGEVVAVAQSYQDCGGFVNGIPRWNIIASKVGTKTSGWGNKLFVRADLMPHRIRIINVRVERLQDISDEDCLAEGVYIHDEDPMNSQAYLYAFPNSPMVYYHSREAYASLIDKISGRGAWKSNPWVFVYDFDLIKNSGI